MASQKDQSTGKGIRELGDDGVELKRRTSASQVPILKSGSGPTKPAPLVRANSSQPGPLPKRVAPPQPSPKKLTAFQQQQLGSAFSSSERQRKLDTVLGASARPSDDDEEGETTSAELHFDGHTAPLVLTGRDVWKAVQAPLQSRAGRRSAEVCEQVLLQFAVGTNPRYEPDAPDKPRGHIFVWDVSRAMNCEIPHFVGAKELTLAQTADWVRHEGPMRGWTRVQEADVFTVARSGVMVVAVPKDIRVKAIAIVAPQEPTADGKPLLTGAVKKRGLSLPMAELFGVRQAEYFTHA